MPALSTQQAVALAAKRRTKGNRNPRSMLIEVQALLLADVRNPETVPSVRAQCARAIEVIEERLRILKGKPLPGQLRPDMPEKYRRKHNTNAAGKQVTLLSSLPADAPPADNAQG